MRGHFIFLGFEISVFCETDLSYQPEKFQIPPLFQSNLTEVGVRHSKNNYDII